VANGAEVKVAAVALDDEISPKEAGELLRVSLTTVYEYIDCDDLPARNIAPSSRGKANYAILRSDVYALIEKQKRRRR
jgi:hypothetical protein